MPQSPVSRHLAEARNQPDLEESHHDTRCARSPGFKCQETRVSCTEREEQCSAMKSEREDEDQDMKQNMTQMMMMVMMKKKDENTNHAIAIVEST